MATVLAHVAEIDSRRIYLPAGYPSMFGYCVGELRMSEDAAKKRIQAARAARQFPVIFELLSVGRMHLSGVCLVTPCLTPENAESLLAAASDRTRAEIEQLLAERFPRSEALPLVQEMRSEGAPGHVSFDGAELGSPDVTEPKRAASPGRSTARPCAADRYTLQLTVSRDTYEKLRHAQSLLRHANPSGEFAEVIDRGMDALIARLEKRKFAATSAPRVGAEAASADPRHVPAAVKRAIWERDEGRCTFVGESGHRCESRDFLELDHVDPVARGGRATVDGMRLRCRGHNQLEAERVFGAEFMARKRGSARRDVGVNAEARGRGRAVSKSVNEDPDLASCLRELGFRANEVGRGVEHGAAMGDATLEERVRAALKDLCRPARCRHAEQECGERG